MKTVKNLVTLAVPILLFVSALADVPKLINYQGRLTTPAGVPVPNATYSVTFTIYDAPSGGTIQWSEVQPVTTIAGQFSVLLGSVTVLSNSIFSDTSRYLGITVSPDPELIPRSRIVSGAYSYRVGTVDGATGGTITSKVSIGPGNTNTGTNAFVAGQNNIASGNNSTVGGGSGNNANNQFSTVAGGAANVAAGDYASVGGGVFDTATGAYATIGGGFKNNVAGNYSTIGGGANNTVSGYSSTVAGGENNAALIIYSTVGGGKGDTASGIYSGVFSGHTNLAGDEAIDTGAFVGGGSNNNATGKYSVVAGGGGANLVDSNSANGSYSAVGGGSRNSASGIYSVVSGGFNNTATDYSTVSGGYGNTATGGTATVGGGSGNIATGTSSTIAGGENNVILGPSSATVGGGLYDTAAGLFSTVPGGRANKASGNYSFAAGLRAKANHLGTFVWADSSADADFASTASNQFLIRAAGGVGIGTNSPLSDLHIESSNPISTNLRIHNTSSTGDADVSFLSNGVFQFTMGIDNDESDKFQISAGSTLSSSERLTITPTGFVGIGTTTPIAKLDVNGSLVCGTEIMLNPPSGMTVIRMNSAAGSDHEIAMENSGSTNWRFGTTGADYRWFKGTDGEKMRLTSAGNLGIGVGVPAYKLEVSGAVMMEDAAAPSASAGHSGVYSSSGELRAFDAAGNSTLLSPHDSETGEWIFYSKNVNTGRVVRVDMEKLVRKMEEITGEKFLMESWEK